MKTAELPDVEPFADAKRCKIYLDAEVGEASADLISKFLAEGALGSLEGEARVRAESYEKQSALRMRLSKSLSWTDIGVVA